VTQPARSLAGMARPRAYIQRIRREGFTPTEFHRICQMSLLAVCAIVVTGAAVRLSGSGLGCDDWPNCNSDKLVDVSSKHSAIEQVNRLFTFLVGLAVVLAALGAWYRKPRRRDLLWLSMAIVAGIPAQGLVGAIVVWTNLHPATVQLHFVLSMVLIALAVVLLKRSSEPDGGRRISSVVPRTTRRVRLLVVWTGLAILAGTVVTGTGTHAGDLEARRFFGAQNDVNGHALQWVTRVHSAVVWIAVASALLLVWQLRRLRHDREVLDAPLTAWCCLAALQGAIGYLQYASGVPAALVGFHVAGATALWAVSVWLWTCTNRVSLSVDELVDHVTVDR